MRRVMRLAIILVLAALIALLAGPAAHAAQPTIQRFSLENEVDPGLSALCTYPLEATVSGKYAIITSTTTSGVRRTIQVQSLEFTFTNATGESVTVRNAFQTNALLTPISENTAEGFRIQGGLSFLYLQQDGTQASAGHRGSLALLTLDSQGNVIGVTPILVNSTPNLAPLGAFICPLLAT